ncbi:molybdopterin molybdenumtransferase MoeA [Siculibacillus lacustris]|uniref:Molybdopterin molybdenumtransferase n=1 Tax=Siculibacillus lacustris TaxID=1549641 RepID=A0A4Q9VTV6_9HYPH|nr:gephyrin-like molybdotransferase Glp [Siculibacillus lacustris]TBW38425.1 molybdopterin molybdenumtransferase MoeA [Siculibacillus lacustris]
MVQLSSDTFAFGGELMSIDTAIGLMVARIPPVAEVESVALAEAEGRILGAAVVAPIDLPVFDNSAVDGYAVAFADLLEGNETVLPIAGRVAAGEAAGTASRGWATRIFTGAPMPAGTDTVFMQEDVRLTEAGEVVLPRGLAKGANARPAGEDIARGTLAIAAGRRLEPRDVALLAALGLDRVSVRRRLRVSVFSTGNELREPGSALGEAAIYDSNRFALMALIRRLGCEVRDLGILRDDRRAIEAAIGEAAHSSDLVVTSGGVSTGDEDHVKAAISAAGSLVFWRLAIKPGRPVAMGLIGGTPLVGLPGNPVAVFITFAHVLRPLILALAGATPSPPMPALVTADFAHAKKAGRREYVRVTLERRGAGVIAVKYPVDGAGVLTSLTRTDGLVELPEALTRVEPGDTVAFYDYRHLA